MTTLSELLAAHDGLLHRPRLSPRLRAIAEHAVAAGDLIALFPGVYVNPDPPPGRDLRVRALFARFPPALLCGATAAQLSFWPELRDDIVHACGVRSRGRVPPGYDISGRAFDPAWVRRIGGVRVTAPALTAVELADETDGGSIDRALRSRRVTLAAMWEAFHAHPHRCGNPDRRRLLLDSRDQPWSAAERLTHRLLRDAGLRGWHGNHPVRAQGNDYFLDIAFPGVRLCIEIDGQAFHSDPGAYETDRARQNDLVLSRWQVLRFTWRMLQADPTGVVRRIRQALDGRRLPNSCR